MTRTVSRAADGRAKLTAQVQQVKETVRPVVRHRPVRLLRHMLKKAWDDRILGLSAEAAFWQLVSIPPLFLALLGSLGYIGDLFGPRTIRSVENELIDASRDVLTPSVVDEIVKPTLQQVLHQGRADVISIGFIIAVWAGSSATATFVNTITIAYDMRELRGAVRSRLIALWLYLAFMLVGVFLLPTLVLGPSKMIKLMPTDLRGDVRDLISIVYWPVVVLILLLALTSLYHLAVPKRLPWRRGLPGAIFAGCIFVAGSYAIRQYIEFISDRAFTYGALAAPIAALLFLFLIALAVLLGAELNASLEQLWPAGPSWRSRLAARRRALRAERAELAARQRQESEPPPRGND